MTYITSFSFHQSKYKLTVIFVLATMCVLFLHVVTGWSLLHMLQSHHKLDTLQKTEPLEFNLLSIPEPAKMPEPIVKKEETKNETRTEETKIEPAPKVNPVPEPVEKEPVVTKPVINKPTVAKPVTTHKPTVSTPTQTKPIEAKPITTQSEMSQTSTETSVSSASTPVSTTPPESISTPAVTTNIVLSASNASWRRQPKFEITTKDARGAKSGEVISVEFKLSIDKTGKITNATLITPSKYPNVNRLVLRQVKRGSFNPFKNKEGIPVSGTLILPSRINIP